MSKRALNVWLNDRLVGNISEGNDLWEFSYDQSWSGAADSFDLGPGLPRSTLHHVDGGSLRPVQWYFDNLLPEEHLRIEIGKQAGIRGGDDAFALLQYLGAESAGSLMLLPPNEPVPAAPGRSPLPDEELSRRIKDLPRHPLSFGAPKRMSLAGAQNKLPVIYQAGQLFEPIASEPSTLGQPACCQIHGKDVELMSRVLASSAQNLVRILKFAAQRRNRNLPNWRMTCCLVQSQENSYTPGDSEGHFGGSFCRFPKNPLD